jgi:hypothetical protein
MIPASARTGAGARERDMLNIFGSSGSDSTTEGGGRLRRIEAKLDRILNHLGLSAKDGSAGGGLSAGAKALADEGRKLDAIKLHRQETGAGLAEAKQAVDEYLAEISAAGR